jgi:hypothetical protein
MKQCILFSVTLLLLTLSACGTAQPAWGEGEFVIETNSHKMLLNVTGSGPIAVIMANTMTGSMSEWSTLVGAVDLQRYTMVNFTYERNDFVTTRRDVSELAAYLRTVGFEKIACLGGSMGAYACGAIAKEPTTMGLILMAGSEGADYEEVTIPKLFIAAEENYRNEIELQYQFAAEPKAIQIYPGNAHATELFASPSGGELIQLIVDFLGAIP